MQRLSAQDIRDLAQRATRAAGFRADVAEDLAEATTDAEVHGNAPVGLRHLSEYLNAAETGFINVTPTVHQQRIASAMTRLDADDGPMQYAFTSNEADFVEAVRTHGIAVQTITNAFAGGELGYYARRLARRDVISIIAVNSPAIMSFGGSADRLLGTNPLCYGVPISAEKAIIVDQASASTALVNVQQLAREGAQLPDDWALDATGQKTTDPTAALAGALLPFGGYKGGNIAMLVELLAVMGGANTSHEAALFYEGTAPPRIGGTMIGIDVQKLPGYPERIDALLHQFSSEHGSDIRLLRDISDRTELIDVPDHVYHDLTQFIHRMDA